MFQVWALAVHVTVLDHDGALVDACFLATMAALMAHRRPDATVDASTSEITVHDPDVREPVALSLHHTPLAVTFALFEVGMTSSALLSSHLKDKRTVVGAECCNAVMPADVALHHRLQAWKDRACKL